MDGTQSGSLLHREPFAYLEGMASSSRAFYASKGRRAVPSFSPFDSHFSHSTHSFPCLKSASGPRSRPNSTALALNAYRVSLGLQRASQGLLGGTVRPLRDSRACA